MHAQAPPTPEVSARICTLFEVYAGTQLASVNALRRLLRGLPPSAYHPQSYTVMRELLEQTHAQGPANILQGMGMNPGAVGNAQGASQPHPHAHLAPLVSDLVPTANPLAHTSHTMGSPLGPSGHSVHAPRQGQLAVHALGNALGEWLLACTLCCGFVLTGCQLL